MAQSADAHDHGDNHGHHIIPVSLLAKVFGALVFLTVFTVVTAKFVDLGPLNVPLALAIAGTKAGLVIAIFMALKYDNKVNTMVFVVGSLFVVVFLAFTLLDTSYRGDLGNVDVQSISEQEREAEALREREPDDEALRVAPADYPSDTTAAAGGGS